MFSFHRRTTAATSTTRLVMDWRTGLGSEVQIALVKYIVYDYKLQRDIFTIIKSFYCLIEICRFARELRMTDSE